MPTALCARAPQGKLVTVGGIRLHYLEAGDGPPIALRHGNRITVDDWLHSGLFNHLARHYYGDIDTILTAVGEDFALSHPHEKGAYHHALAMLGGPILFLGGTLWMKAVSSRVIPWSHCAGIVFALACFFLVPTLENHVLQFLAVGALFLVALWEYVALTHFRRTAT